LIRCTKRSKRSPGDKVVIGGDRFGINVAQIGRR
jgi:hypothetical protein